MVSKTHIFTEGGKQESCFKNTKPHRSHSFLVPFRMTKEKAMCPMWLYVLLKKTISPSPEHPPNDS
jgi:hypothetical protein